MHNNSKKLSNLLSIYRYRTTGQDKVNAYPPILKIEVNNICQLKCPGCPTGLGTNPDPKGQISFDTFKNVIDKVGDYAYWVELFGWGEPFLNKNLFDIINYSHTHNIGTCASSNFLALNEKDINEMIKAGLTQVVISMDGITQETYQKYRKGGDIEKLLNNLKYLLRRKDELKSHFPVIEVHFITMEHNLHELNEATEYMRRLDLNRFYFLIKDSGPGEYIPFHDVPDEKIIIKNLRRNLKKCKKLWYNFHVCWNGDVRPCCHTFGNIGNINEEDFYDIWNNEMFRTSRKIVCPGKENMQNTNSPCLTCYLVRTRMKEDDEKTTT